MNASRLTAILFSIERIFRGLSPGALGRRGLNEVAQAIMEKADIDTLTVHGRYARRGATPDGAQGPSSLDVVLVLKRVAPIDRPVDVALTLKRFGLRLSEAHKALDRIVADEAVQLRLGHADRATMIADLAELGVAAD